MHLVHATESTPRARVSPTDSCVEMPIREKPGANMIMDLGGKQNQNRMINEIQLIKSRALAKKVVQEL